MTSPRPPASSVLPTLFLADWSKGLQVGTEWATDIQQAQGGAEVRRGLVSKPYRNFTVRFLAVEGGGLRALQEVAIEASQAELVVPAWTDSSTLQSQALAGATTLSCDTTLRRFTAGSLVIVAYKASSRNTVWSYEIKTIQAVSASSITLTSPLSSSWPTGSRVYPAFVSEVEPNPSYNFWTSETGEAEFKLREKFTETGLGARVTPGSLPAGFQSFSGLPIFDFNPFNESSLEVKQTTASTVVGLSSVHELYGAPSFSQNLTITSTDRASAFRLIDFFDSRGGRLYPFWAPEPVRAATITSVSSGSFTFTGDQIDYSSWVDKHVAFVLKDGTISCHRVISASAGTASVSPSIPASVTLENLKRFCRLRLCRFESDALTEEWATSQNMKAKVSLNSLDTYLDAELSASIPYVPDSGASGDPGQWGVDGACQASAPISPLPMYVVDCFCRDTNRPMFRGADLTAPQSFKIEFKDLARSTLSGPGLSSLMSFLKSQAFKVSYSSSAAGTSRHWHHLRWNGASWSLPSPVNVTRHIWEAVESYVGDSGASASATIRVVAEVPSSDSEGSHGAIFNLYVFTDEVSYSDGTPYNSGGAWPTSVTFSVSDPAVWETTDLKKRCHPRLVICAHIPTTMESACGFAAYDIDPSSGLTEYCSSLDPGLPWSSGSSWPDQPTKNVVFGHGSGYEMAAVTLGGGCPTSEVFDWVTVETEVSLFNCPDPGWDSTRSQLQFGNANIILTPCLPDQSGLACCDGHPSSPNKGSPQCWSSIGIGAFRIQCCFSTQAPLRVSLNQKLQVATKCFDSMGNETSNDVSCSDGLTQDLEIPVYSVDFKDQSISTPEDQTLRSITWKTWKDDPTATPQDYQTSFSGINPPDTATFTADSGSWTVASGVVTCSSAGQNVYRMDAYSSYRDFEARFSIVTPTKDYGFLFRTTATAPITGYYLQIDPVGKHVWLYSVVAGVKTLVSGVPFTILPASGNAIAVRVVRDTVEVWTEDEEGLLLGDSYPHFIEYVCSATAGPVSLVSNESGVQFSSFSVVDLFPPQVSLEIKFDKDGWHITMDKAFWPSYERFPTGTYDSDPSCTVSCCHEIGEFIPNASVSAAMSGTLGSDWGCGGPPDGSTLKEIGPCGGFPSIQFYPPYSTCLSSQNSCCSSEGGSGTGYWQWSGSAVVITLI